MSLQGDAIKKTFMIRFRLTELIADKAFKERRVVSLSEVAEATGVHRATLSKMANQPGANIGTEIIDKLCTYFGCQPGDLLSYIESDEVGNEDRMR
jgi:putative transcriptional regulator